MTFWKLSIKPANQKGFNPFEICKENSLIGIGWSGAFKNSYPVNVEQAKDMVIEEYGKFPYPIKYFTQDLKIEDSVWIHQGGKYFMCVVESELLYGEQIHPNFIELDLGHARKAKWKEIPDILVSGKIQRGVIAQRMLQKIKGINQFEKAFYKKLFNLTVPIDQYLTEIDINKYDSALNNLDIDHFYSLATPDEIEDIVCFYLQDKGWRIIKSTCFRSKPVFEFEMINKKKKVAKIQIKSGMHPDRLPIDNYIEFVSSNSEVFLFSTAVNPYPGKRQNGIHTIDKIELFEWLKNNNWNSALNFKLKLLMYEQINADNNT